MNKPGEVVELAKRGQRQRTDFAKFCEVWDKTHNYYQALLSAGHSEKVAKQGRAGLSAREVAYVDGKFKAQELETPGDSEVDVMIEGIKTADDMLEFLKKTSLRYIAKGQAAPKGLDSLMKIAGTLKGNNVFVQERGEGSFNVSLDSAKLDELDGWANVEDGIAAGDLKQFTPVLLMDKHGNVWDNNGFLRIGGKKVKASPDSPYDSYSGAVVYQVPKGLAGLDAAPDELPGAEDAFYPGPPPESMN